MRGREKSVACVLVADEEKETPLPRYWLILLSPIAHYRMSDDSYHPEEEVVQMKEDSENEKLFGDIAQMMPLPVAIPYVDFSSFYLVRVRRRPTTPSPSSLSKSITGKYPLRLA